MIKHYQPVTLATIKTFYSNTGEAGENYFSLSGGLAVYHSDTDGNAEPGW